MPTPRVSSADFWREVALIDRDLTRLQKIVATAWDAASAPTAVGPAWDAMLLQQEECLLLEDIWRHKRSRPGFKERQAARATARFCRVVREAVHHHESRCEAFGAGMHVLAGAPPPPLSDDDEVMADVVGYAWDNIFMWCAAAHDLLQDDLAMRQEAVSPGPGLLRLAARRGAGAGGIDRSRSPHRAGTKRQL